MLPCLEFKSIRFMAEQDERGRAGFAWLTSAQRCAAQARCIAPTTLQGAAFTLSQLPRPDQRPRIAAAGYTHTVVATRQSPTQR